MGTLQVRLPEPLILSSDLRNYILKIKDNELVNKLQSKIIRPPINYLDIASKNNEVVLSFLDAKRATKKQVFENKFRTPLRQDSKIGKGLRKLFPKISDDIIRPFVENLQGLVQADDIKCFIVQGDDIRKVYQWPRKYCVPGSLQSSCFQGIAIDENFELFARNPEKIKLAVAMQNGFLIARQLIFYGTRGEEPCWIGTDLNGTGKGYSCLDRFVAEYNHGCPRLKEYYDINFVVKDLVDGVPLHHFGMSYHQNKNGTAYLKTGNYCREMGKKWYKNPDAVNNGCYSTFKKPVGTVVIPEDLASEGLERFWP